MQCSRMKREGHGHGMVRTYRILPSSYNRRLGSRSLNTLSSHPIVVPFAKVPATLPTNHKLTNRAQVKDVEGQPELPANKLNDGGVEKVEITIENDSENENGRGFSVVEGDFDASMSFCDVGSVLSQVEGEDDGWCLVGENAIA